MFFFLQFFFKVLWYCWNNIFHRKYCTTDDSVIVYCVMLITSKTDYCPMKYFHKKMKQKCHFYK